MTREKIIRGSENVFKDIAVTDPERTLIRARIMSYITDILKEQGLTQAQAARVLNLTQPKVSCLMNGKLSMFSLERLFQMLNALQQDVTIIVKPKPPHQKTATTRASLVV